MKSCRYSILRIFDYTIVRMSSLAEYGGVIIGVLMAVLPPVFDDRRSDGRVNWFSRKNLVTLTLGALSAVFNIISVNRAIDEKVTSEKEMNSLHKEIRFASSKIQNMTTSQAKFEKFLFSRFNIKKGKIDGLPYRVNTYNTTVGRAQTVNIGNN